MSTFLIYIQSTGRTTEVPIQTATLLQEKGYKTKLYVMSTPKLESYLGTLERYEDMYSSNPRTARATPKQAHDVVVDQLTNNLEELFNKSVFSDIRLYDRKGTKLYSSLESPSTSPKSILEKELNRKLNGKEIQPVLERIESKMIANQHQKTPEFQAIKQILQNVQPQVPPVPKSPKLPGL